MFPRNVERIIINLVFKVFHAPQGDLNLSLSPPHFSKLLAAGVVSCQKQIPNQSSIES
jgi:hypothetical protein